MATTPSPRAAHASDDAPMKVGDLARRTGLTVRALHHYDEIGLLSPSLRTPSGHRLYARADVERLQQVSSLRAMGLPLDEVKRLLDGATLSPRQVIELQLSRLRAQIDLQTRLAERLEALVNHPHSESASVESLCRLIEVMTRMERFFTPAQLLVMEQRRSSISPERLQEVQQAWAEIIPAVQAHMDAGDPPTTPAVQAIGRRWRGLVDEMTGGDREMQRSIRSMYEQRGPELRAEMQSAGKWSPTKEMFVYMDGVFASLD